MPEDLPIDHVLRHEPPWREAGHRTECGRLTSDVASVVDREAIRAKVAKLGVQRAAFTTCMVCAERAKYYNAWEQDPVNVLMRETRGVGSDVLKLELRALTLLWEAHQEEFREALEGLGQVSQLQPRRRRAR